MSEFFKKVKLRSLKQLVQFQFFVKTLWSKLIPKCRRKPYDYLLII